MATDAEVLGALRSKLVAYESAGMTDLVKRVKARIAEFEKPAKTTAPAAAEKAPAPAKTPAAKKTAARKPAKSSAAVKKSAATRAAKKSKET